MVVSPPQEVTSIDEFEQFKALMDLLPSAVSVFDKNMCYRITNRQWLVDYKLKDVPIIGRSYLEIFPNTSSLWPELFARALAGETIVNPEDRLELLDGSAIFYNWRLIPWYEKGSQQPTGVIMISQDITNIVTTQLTREVNLTDGIRASRERAENLAKINAALSQATDEDTILAAIAAFAEQHGVAISSLSYAVIDETGYPYATNVVANRSGDGHIIPLSQLPRTYFLTAKTPPQRLAFSNPDAPIFIENVFTDPRCEEGDTREVLKAAKMSACIIFPLKSGDEWQGSLTCAWREPQVFGEDIRQFFTTVRPTLASVVASRRSYLKMEVAQRRSESLSNLNAALSQASNEDEILQAVAGFAESYGVTLSTLSYAQVDAEGNPVAANVVAVRSGDGHIIPVNQLPQQLFDREDSPPLDLAFRYPNSSVFIEDVYTDPRFEAGNARDVMKAANMSACIMLPLKDSAWNGVLTCAWDKPQTFNEEIRYLFEAARMTLVAVVARRRLYLQTLEHVENLKELDRLKNEFMSTMSHELRTPLNAVIGLGDIILSGLDGELPPKAEMDIQTIFNAGQQLLGIVNDILDIAKIESGRLDLILTPVHIIDPINEAMDTAQVLADNKKLKVVINAPEDLPAIQGDATRLRQIILNLLNNAIKFTESGGVEISATADANALTVCVRDEGIGIDPKHHKLVFEQFRQVEGAITRKKGGTGLGLPISKKLVELHGGQMWLESALGQGSKFYFSLPLHHGGTK